MKSDKSYGAKELTKKLYNNTIEFNKGINKNEYYIYDF